jgi:hypothetical protein
MKIVKTGEITRIFSDDLQTFDKIPVGNYKVCFHPMMGFYLEDADSFKNNEKPYGKHPLKISKVVALYQNIERSAGIILSGKKGMGKSMFARLLSEEFASKHDMPTIMVTEAFKGIVDFIESIKQECVILFDEFEKVFDSERENQMREKPSNKESQDRLLGLFDGLSQTKRMYVITVNEIRRVSQYMINRPGRFHYHIQFNYPSAAEIELYLKDKLLPQYQNQITLVQRFANRFDLNYDSLRAIAFELNNGYGFLETMEDLNISSSENQRVKYNVEVHYSNGLVAKSIEEVDLMSSDYAFGVSVSGEYARITFSPLEVEIHNKDSFVVNTDDVKVDVRYDSDNEILNDESEIIVTKLVFNKQTVGAQFGKEMANLF